jgi:uncharacterized membrane protein YvlD (DUF360 family)
MVLTTLGVRVQVIGLGLWGVMVSASAFWMGLRGEVSAGNG